MDVPMSDLVGYVVRPPLPRDAPELGRMHCGVWQETYAEVMDPQAYAALSPERFTQGWQRRLQGVDGEGRMTTGDRMAVAEHGAEGIVAFINVGPSRDENAPTQQQLWTLNVVAGHQGTGLAQQLMAEVLGEGPAYLWVAKGNDRAMNFYRRHGFAEDGTEIIDEDDGIIEIRMVRPQRPADGL